MAAPVDELEKFQQEFTFEDDDEDDFGGTSRHRETTFDQNAVNHIRQAAAEGKPNPLITPSTGAPAAGAENEVPEYFKEFEDVINNPFAKPEPKNYGAEAVQKFGPDFAHLDSPEAIYDQSLYNDTVKKFIGSKPEYNEAKAVLSADFNMGDLVKETIYQQMEQNFSYTEEKYQEQLDQYFENGQLNDKGRSLAARLKGHYNNQISNIESQARAEANRKVADQKEYRATLEAELKSYNPFGVELPEEARTHIQEIIRQGKHKQEPKTNSEKAQREFLTALLSDKKAMYTFMKAVHDRGSVDGANQAARKKFSN